MSLSMIRPPNPSKPCGLIGEKTGTGWGKRLPGGKK
jgi:hypothetical protein